MEFASEVLAPWEGKRVTGSQRRAVPMCPALTSPRASTARAPRCTFLFTTILLLLLLGNPPAAAQRSRARPSGRCSIAVHQCSRDQGATAATGLSPRPPRVPSSAPALPGHRGPCNPGDGLQVNAWRVSKSSAEAAPKVDFGQTHPVIPNLMPPWTRQCQVPVLPL